MALFTVEDLREPYRIERVLQQFNEEFQALQKSRDAILKMVSTQITTPISTPGNGAIPGTPVPGSPIGSTVVNALNPLTNHAIVLGDTTSPNIKSGTLGTTTTVLHGNAAGDPSYAAVSLTADVTGTLPIANGGTGATAVPARTASSPADPAGTASLVGVMMGLAGAITPVVSGKVMITITGEVANDTNNDGGRAQIRYGTGAAPANGAALTGTTAGVYKGFDIEPSANDHFPFALCFYVTGLTVATAYWIDVGLKAITGGTTSIFNIDIVAIELNA